MSRWQRLRTPTKALIWWTVLGLACAVALSQGFAASTEPYEVEALIFGSFYLAVAWLIGVVVLAVIWAVKKPSGAEAAAADATPRAPAVSGRRQALALLLGVIVVVVIGRVVSLVLGPSAPNMIYLIVGLIALAGGTLAAGLALPVKAKRGWVYTGAKLFLVLWVIGMIQTVVGT